MTRRTAFYDGKNHDPNCSVGWLLRRVSNSIRNVVDDRMVDHDLTHAQWAPLLFISLGRGSTPAELARLLDMDTGAMTRTLDRLEEKGFLERERSAEDRRVVKLELTAAGKKLTEIIPLVIAAVLNDHLAGFSKAEHTQLVDMLGRMLANGERLVSGPQQEA